MRPQLHRHRCLFLLALFANKALDPAAIVLVDSWSPSIRSATWRSCTARHASQPSEETAATTTASRPGKSSWFPIHPADALSPSNDYDTIVKSAYLRHVFVETEQMADLIVDLYLSGGRLQDTGNFIIADGHDDGEIRNHALEASNGQCRWTISNVLPVCRLCYLHVFLNHFSPLQSLSIQTKLTYLHDLLDKLALVRTLVSMAGKLVGWIIHVIKLVTVPWTAPETLQHFQTTVAVATTTTAITTQQCSMTQFRKSFLIKSFKKYFGVVSRVVMS
jgi:hypothetical protein